MAETLMVAIARFNKGWTSYYCGGAVCEIVFHDRRVHTWVSYYGFVFHMEAIP